jgi:phosphonate transport system substrate-binding protein
MWTPRFLLFVLLLSSCRSGRLEEVTIAFDAGVAAPAASRPAEPGLRFSVAAIQSPEGTYGGYSRLLNVLADRLGTGVTLVQRRSYRETNDMLVSGRIDVAFVCTGGYFDLLKRGAKVDVLAVPVMRGLTTYQSLIIVPAKSAAQRLEDLAGKRFAFTDELSMTGYAFPTFVVRSSGLDPQRFFASAYFTHGHDRSIEAVSRGLVDGAAVDSNIFEDLVAADPPLGTRLRVLLRSEPFGIPPIVALETLDGATRERVRRSLLGLHERPEAAALMKEIGIERFVAPPPGTYDTAFAVARVALP